MLITLSIFYYFNRFPQRFCLSKYCVTVCMHSLEPYIQLKLQIFLTAIYGSGSSHFFCLKGFLCSIHNRQKYCVLEIQHSVTQFGNNAVDSYLSSVPILSRGGAIGSMPDLASGAFGFESCPRYKVCYTIKIIKYLGEPTR